MNPFRLLVPLVVFAAAAGASAFDSSPWAFRQPVTLDLAGPVRLTLPAETLDAARADLADLRLLGPDGAEIPFAIVRHNTVRPTTERIPLQARLEGQRTVVEFGLAKAVALQRIVLETPATAFTKGATVEVEDEPGNWQRVLDSALVFRMRSGFEQLALDLGSARGRTIRITLDDTRSPPIPLTAVVVETGAGAPEQLLDLPVVITAIEQEAGATRLTLDLGLRHRPLAELVLAAREPVFQRTVRLVAERLEDDEVVEETLAAGTLARLELPENRHYAQLALPVDEPVPAARLELVIDNGDSPPLSDIHITARLRRIDIGFAAPTAGTYTLLAGAPHVTAPRYDVAAFSADWGRLPSLAAPAAERTANPGHRPAQMPVDVPELGGPIDVTNWLHARDVRLAAPGAQILELDPAALAGSRYDLGDLRLTRGDRQVPYLLERTSRTRSVPLALVAAPDEKRPTVGRWELALPVAGMPVSTLRLTINEPVFSRSVLVGEILEDSRGQPRIELLGGASIQRRGTEDPATFAIPLQSRPRSGTLFVEIDHGDNAGFTPFAAEAVYPVRRLRFRATETTGCTLLYGNRTASAPRYDLQLAAPRLLAAIQHPATLETLEGAGASRSTFSLGGPAARYAFWGALAVVVVVLLWLVARLLPKPPPSGS